MLLRIFSLLLITISALADGQHDAFKTNQARIAAEIEAVPVSKSRMTLYSLDPDMSKLYSRSGELKPEYTNRLFHGFMVFGKAEITAETEKAALLKAFARGIRESDGSVAHCFNPRHGLRLITNSSTNDFTICFECHLVQTDGFNHDPEFAINSSPAGEFNDAVSKHHLKKTESGN